MHQDTVSLPSDDGKNFDAYRAAPDAGRAPGIVIAQEIFGVNRALKATADDFAARGFPVMVPDLFWRLQPGTDLGYSDSDRQAAMGLMGKFDVAQGVQDIGRAVEGLRAHPACNGKVAVVGFCLGGTLAFLSAARLEVDAAVSYYGTAIQKSLAEAPNVVCPLLLHFAEQDGFVPPDAVAEIRAAFEGRPDVTIHTYPGVGHAFCNVDRSGIYDPAMAALAHSRTESFLRGL